MEDFKLNKKMIISLTGVAMLIIGVFAGTFLVQQRQIFKPKAYSSEEERPIIKNTALPQKEIGFTLSSPGEVKVNQTVRVSVYAKSDSDTANLFVARIKFPANLLKVEGLEVSSEKSFIKNWAQTFYDNNQGVIALIGGVPSPGVQTKIGSEGLLMTEIVFKSQATGAANLTLSDSAIYRNSDNSNILTTKREASINIAD